ncbi:FAD-dependent oxidoreductase [Nitrospirillum viridazoti]|uniref:GMC family oxidoreductase n=1 Tax=Nitrospirillum viridazoti CBAmc TaxID=1441467 RepID=A0A248JP28_9PROT|nr:GMC family oxidoreductase [Nitrospirillum amazonense]ASG20286.1 GMC family oxidoreductase [Nitrospirillum amazonense CBAmc]TWB27953.1 choline dehydrogenase-like flavoprotein [Nitrospirillum amazonense]
MSTEFDAIVVGSGITGGWAAKELTEKGLKVLMVERGRMIEHGSGYVTETLAPWEMPFRGEGDAALYARDFAVQSKNRHFTEFTQNHFVNDRDNPYSVAEGTEFNWWRGYQLGGRSLTWGRQSYRMSDYDFGANKKDGHGSDWPIRYADLAPWYDHVERFIGVSGQAEGVASLPDGVYQPPMALNVLERYAKGIIEQRWPDRRLTIGRTANLTQEKEGRSACQYRSICARGCSYGAYFSTQSSTLPAAQRTGNLTLITDTVVERVDYDARTRRATGVSVLNVKTGERRRHTARIVFLNAGAFNTNHLLLRSGSDAFPTGLGNSSGLLGTHIMDHATTVGAVALFDRFQDRTTYGNRPTGVVIPRFRNLDRQEGDFLRGYSFQGGALRSTWTRAKREAGVGADFKAAMRGPGGWRMVLVSFAESLPRPTNRLTLDLSKTDAVGAPLLKIDFSHGENERKALADAGREASAMLTAAGGKVVLSLDRPGAGGSAIHEMGGAMMGDNPRTSVTNRWNQLHDVPNVFVSDGAAMASSACQNPSLTYMALTARACDAAVRLLREAKI